MADVEANHAPGDQDMPSGLGDDQQKAAPMSDMEDGEVSEDQISALKRQASHEEEQGASQKRQRRNSQRSSTPPNNRQTEHKEPERPKPATQEEKKRGKRLFGGLLSNLSQRPSSIQQQQRRQEIEKRQQEKMQKQEAQDDQHRTEKAAKMKQIRLKQQITFDEKVMKHKQSKKLALAKFLRTRSEPRIYYLPWKCTERQKDIIDEQIDEARREMDRQWEGFESRRQRHIEKYGMPMKRHSDSYMDEDRIVDQKAVKESGSASEGTKGESLPVSGTRKEEELADIVEEAGDDEAIY